MARASIDIATEPDMKVISQEGYVTDGESSTIQMAKSMKDSGRMIIRRGRAFSTP